MKIINKWGGLALAIAIASAFIFTNLGDAYFWADEAQTAALSVNTLAYGYPKVWDGKNLLTHSMGYDFNDDLVFTSNPWMQFYICSLSLFLFGKTTLAARLPFALLGVATIIIVWNLAMVIYRKRLLANITSLIMSIYVPYLLYSRQCRYYSLVFFLTSLASLFYLKLIRNSVKRYVRIYLTAGLALSLAALLFSDYTAFIIWGITAFIYTPLKIRYSKWHNITIPFIAALLLISPWITYIMATQPPDVFRISADIGSRFLVVLWKLQVYFIPYITLAAIVAVIQTVSLFWHKRQSRIFIGDTLFFVLLIAVNIVIISIPDYYILNHYMISSVIAVPFILVSILVFLSRFSRGIAFLTIFVCISSNILNIAPYMLIKESDSKVKSYLQASKAVNAMKYDISTISRDKTVWGLYASPVTNADCSIQPLDKFLEELSIKSYIALLFQEITHEFSSPPEEVVKILKKYGHPNENVVVMGTEYEYIAFYTDMRVVNNFDSQYSNDTHFHPQGTHAQFDHLTKVNDSKIDWIIVSRYGRTPKQSFYDPYYLKRNIDEFEYIPVNATDSFISNSPDLDIHKFVTDTRGPLFYVLHRRR